MATGNLIFSSPEYKIQHDQISMRYLYGRKMIMYLWIFREGGSM